MSHINNILQFFSILTRRKYTYTYLIYWLYLHVSAIAIKVNYTKLSHNYIGVQLAPLSCLQLGVANVELPKILESLQTSSHGTNDSRASTTCTAYRPNSFPPPIQVKTTSNSLLLLSESMPCNTTCDHDFQ